MPTTMIHDRQQRYNLSVPFKSTLRGQQSVTYVGLHVWNFVVSKINPICSIGSCKRHLRLLLQHCYVSDLRWWSLTFEKINNKKCSPNHDPHVCICCMCFICMYVYIYIYIYIYICMCVRICMHVCAYMSKHKFVCDSMYICMCFCGILMFIYIWLIIHFVFIIFVWDKNGTALRLIQCGVIMAWSKWSFKILPRDKPLLVR